MIFIEHPEFFDRPNPYGDANGEYPDNRPRFAFFSRAVIEYFRSRGVPACSTPTGRWAPGPST